MEHKNVKNISGHANPDFQQFSQHTGTPVVALNFHAFKPVGGNATFTELIGQTGSNATAEVATAYNASGTYYQSELYTGSFKGFTLATGSILTYLTEQD